MERITAYIIGLIVDFLKNTRVRKAFALLVFWGLGFFMNSIYRPYIYVNRIDDFGIADMGNNLFFVPSTSLALSLVKNINTYDGNRNWIIINFFTLAFVELLSSRIKVFGHYDFKDIIGLFIGTLIALRLNVYLERKRFG